MNWSLEDFVYGATDGAVTTFAVVAGVTGASLSPSIVLILGFAKFLADGLSMAVGNYLAAKTRLEYLQNVRRREEWEIDKIWQNRKSKKSETFMQKRVQGGSARRNCKGHHIKTEGLGRYHDERRARFSIR